MQDDLERRSLDIAERRRERNRQTGRMLAVIAASALAFAVGTALLVLYAETHNVFTGI
jgi:hypothetical protein